MCHCGNERIEQALQPTGASGVFGGLLRGARSVLAQVGVGPGHAADPLAYLDARLLSDIGIGADSIRRDPPRHAWPH